MADQGKSQPGEAVRVVSQQGQCLGVAHYSAASQITLRLLTHKDEPLDRAFYLARLRTALEFRQRAVSDTDSYRLVHAEGDLLPG